VTAIRAEIFGPVIALVFCSGASAQITGFITGPDLTVDGFETPVISGQGGEYIRAV